MLQTGPIRTHIDSSALISNVSQLDCIGGKISENTDPTYKRRNVANIQTSGFFKTSLKDPLGAGVAEIMVGSSGKLTYLALP